MPKYRDRTGRCIRILLKNIGVRGRMYTYLLMERFKPNPDTAEILSASGLPKRPPVSLGGGVLLAWLAPTCALHAIHTNAAAVLFSRWLFEELFGDGNHVVQSSQLLCGSPPPPPKHTREPECTNIADCHSLAIFTAISKGISLTLQPFLFSIALLFPFSDCPFFCAFFLPF